MTSFPTPPSFFLRFFRWYCRPKLREFIEGDLLEVYRERMVAVGKRKADIRFGIDVLLLFRPGIINTSWEYHNTNQMDMIKSYFKIAWRSLLKRRGFSFINIAGLSAGMSVALLIGLWIHDEVFFDWNFQNHNRLAKVMINQSMNGETYSADVVAVAFEDPLRTQYGASFSAMSLVSWNNAYNLSLGEKSISIKGNWVQPDFPRMFTLHMTLGDRNALNDPSTMLISSSVARALFGEADPLNKTVRIDNGLDLRVGGVYADLPPNCSFSDAKILLPWNNKANNQNVPSSWSNHLCQLFVELSPQVRIEETSQAIKNVPTPHIQPWTETLFLQPLNRLHLYDNFTNGKEDGGRIEYVWMFGIIGAFVLGLACINFMNLSTARSERRSKEVGIRKTAGSARSQLVSQFLIESILLSFLALIIALLASYLTLPFFNSLAEKQMTMPWQSPVFWLLALVFALLTGVLSGSYPAFYLSSFKPVIALKKSSHKGATALSPRKVLVVLQFSISVTLIIGTLFVYQQIQYAKSRPAGYTRDGLVTVWIKTTELHQHYQALHNELLQSGAVTGVAISSQSPAQFGNNNSIDWPGKDPSTQIFFRNVTVSPDFGKTIGWTVIQGRDFSSDRLSDSSAVIVNKRAAEDMEMQNPIGQQITYGDEKYTIIGVVDDMITQSPYDPSEPSFFILKGWVGCITMRLNPGQTVHNDLSAIEPIFKKYDPSSPFDYSFVDQDFAQKFENEERIGKLAALFAGLAIAISCLGMFGLAAFSAEQRTKEIGIRKVLGASVPELWVLLSRDFLLLVAISCAIAAPLSGYFMSGWLQKYTYRTPLSWSIFVYAVASALVITIITVSFQTIKAAIVNPVKNLRSE